MTMMILAAIALQAATPTAGQEAEMERLAAPYLTCVAEAAKRLMVSGESAEAVAMAAVSACSTQLTTAADGVVAMGARLYPRSTAAEREQGRTDTVSGLRAMARTVAVRVVVELRARAAGQAPAPSPTPAPR